MRCRLAPRIAATSTLFAFAFPQKRFNHSTSGGNAPPVQLSPSAVPHGTTPQLPKHTATDSLPIKDPAELYFAADRGDADAVRLLLDNGADVNAVMDNTGCTPLHAAVSSGDVLLVDHGADSNAKDFEGFAALHLAAGVAITKVLIGSGADLNVKDKRGMTPLHYASRWTTDKRVRVLADAGADLNAVDDKSRTPLHIAATVRGGATARALIDAGADLNAVDSKSHTPLYVVAALRGGVTADVIIDGLLALKAQEAQSKSASVKARRPKAKRETSAAKGRPAQGSQ